MSSQYWRLVFVAFLLVVVALLWGKPAQAPAVLLTMNNHAFSVEFADTSAAWEKGLGGRDALPADHAMLFRYDSSARRCFWMKDMRFSLDIIWISSARKIVHIEPNVSPVTYPKTFCPNAPAQYVLEVNAGTANRLNLRAGDSISF